MIAPDWIAVDWGTSHLRAYSMTQAGRVLAKAQSPDGMGALTPDAFEPALLRLIEPWLSAQCTPVLACGMVGAKQGWVEAPYRAAPCVPHLSSPINVTTHDNRISMQILPGVCQNKPADVMRGEETQVAGVLAEQPEFDGVVCLPGTHSKWVHISASEIVSFQTAMTGEMFDLMANQSVLRHSVSSDALDQHAFDDAISQTLSRPERLAQAMFGIRAEGLLHGLDSAKARGRLSGLLIGAELAATRPYWLGQNVLVGGAPALVALYARALAAQGVPVQTRDAERLTLAGLCLARQSLSEARH